MDGRALPISLYSPPKRQRPPDTSGSRNSGSNLNFKLHFRVRVQFLSGSSVHVLLNGSRGRNQFWKVRSDVKSEPYEISKSAPESFKFKEKLGVDVVSKDDDGDEFVVNAVPWWEEFPKRWTIVILCFSAFLLCNMDRVSSSHYYFAKFYGIYTST